MAEFDILIPLLFNVTDCSQFLIYTGFSPYGDIFIGHFTTRIVEDSKQELSRDFRCIANLTFDKKNCKNMICVEYIGEGYRKKLIPTRFSRRVQIFTTKFQKKCTKVVTLLYHISKIASNKFSQQK
jgi:hypothetical protein